MSGYILSSFHAKFREHPFAAIVPAKNPSRNTINLKPGMKTSLNLALQVLRKLF
jgi:hypothetical protein